MTSTQDASQFDAIIALKSTDGVLDVSMFSPRGGVDLKNPADFMAFWLSNNWDHLVKLMLVNYTTHKEQAEKGTDPEVTLVKEPSLMLLSAEGTPLQRSH